MIGAHLGKSVQEDLASLALPKKAALLVPISDVVMHDHVQCRAASRGPPGVVGSDSLGCVEVSTSVPSAAFLISVGRPR